MPPWHSIPPTSNPFGKRTTMARIHTHYDNLKVARDAPPEVIRAAYKTLSQKYHPDRNPDNPDAIRIIQVINTAYDVLSDPVKRREHDEWIARKEAEANKRRQQSTRSESFVFTADMQGNCSDKGTYRSSRSSKQRSHRRSSTASAEVMEMTRMILDRFSKYFFRKT